MESSGPITHITGGTPPLPAIFASKLHTSDPALILGLNTTRPRGFPKIFCDSYRGVKYSATLYAMS